MFISPNMVYAEAGENTVTIETGLDETVNKETPELVDDQDVPAGEAVEGEDQEDEEAEDQEGEEAEDQEDEEAEDQEGEGETSERKLFTDVPENHWAFNVIHELSDKDIVKGMSETTFAPAKQMTRAEFVTLLVNTLELEATETSKFVDVAVDAWYANTVQAAYEAGIVKGMSETHFGPNKNITREEMATMILQAYELKKGEGVADAEEATFADGGQISAWAKENVNKVVTVGLMKGRAEDQFAPKGITNRAEGAQVIFNLLNK